jgi:molybdate transport system permease protein
MIGGNRPQFTRTLSISIYDQVQEMRMEAAGQTALVLLMFSFLVLSLTQWIGRREVGV